MAGDILELAFDELTVAREALDALRIKVLCPVCHRIVVTPPPAHYRAAEITCPACGGIFYVGAVYVANSCPYELVQAVQRAQAAV